MKYGKRMTIVLAVCVVLSSISVIYARHESRKLFVVLQSEKANRDDLVIEYGQLQLEQSAWATHGRVDEIARERLAMRLPEHSEVILLKK